MNNKVLIGGSILLVLLGYATGRYIQPAKIVTKTEVVTKTNTVTVDHIHTVTVTKELPNGEKDTTTVTDNNSTTKEKETIDDKSSTVTTYSKPAWKVSALAGLNANNIGTPTYGGQIEHRLVGPIGAGIWGLSSGQGGISLSLEF